MAATARIQLLLFLSFLLTFSSCVNDLKKVNLFVDKTQYPIQVSKNTEVVYSDSALLKLRLMAKKIERYEGEEPYIELKDGVHVWLYNDDQSVSSEISSNYAIKKEKEDIMEAKNNVVVINEKGETLNTEHLIWDQKSAKIYSNVFVKITTAEEIIYGDGFESNQEFTKYRINKIKGTIQLKEDE